MSILTNLRKGIAAVSVFALMLMVSPTFAAVSSFTDASSIPSWANEAIEELMDQGVINGNDDGSFAPNRQLNRAEVSKIIVLATGVELDTDGGNKFPDVNSGDWFYDYVTTMYNYGWINGNPDGTFRPGNGINRAELAKMIVNAFELDVDTTGAPHFSDVNSDAWFYDFVETAYNNGLMRGYADGTFGPNGAVTRAETVKITYDGQLVVAAPTGQVEGTLEVALSDDTPRGTNIPFNATSVPYTTLELTASDDSDVEVSALTITRLGLGDNDDFDNVWLEIDGFKVGNDKSVNNDDVVELRFNPPIVVPAGQTLVADVVASMEIQGTLANPTNIGSDSRLSVVAADDIVSTAANVVGDFPLEGEEMEIANYQVTQIGVSTLGSDTTIDVGDNFIEIGKFRMLNETATNKDVELRAITFKNDGTAQLADVVENGALYVSGEQVSAETIIDGDYITFRLDNGVTGGYVIEDGDSRIFSIRADIVSAEDGDVINFKVDNFEDIVAVEIGTSFGAKAVSDDAAATTFANGSTTDAGTACQNNADAEDNCARLRAYSIDSGDINVSRDPASLGNQQYAPGSNDVVVLTARIIVDQPVIVDGVTLRVGTGTDANGALGGVGTLANLNDAFDNFRLFLNDKLVDSENNFSGTTVADANLPFNTTFEIAGTSVMKLVANVENAAPTGSQLKVTLDADDFDSPEYISTGDQITTDELLGSAEGSFVEITSSEVTITKTDGLSNGETVVAGVNDVTFLEFVLDNNDSGDVNVTSVTVTADATVNANNAGVGVSGSARTYTNNTVAVFVDGVQQGSSKNLSTAGVATFNDLSVVIPSAGQKEFAVIANTIEASANGITTNISDAGGAVAESGAATWTVASTTGMTVGDIIVVNEAANTDVRAITAVNSATSITVDSNAANDYSVAATVTVRHQLKLNVTAVDVDNVENGQTITVQEGGADLGTANPLVGAAFELVEAGTLTISSESTVYSDLLVAGQSAVEVLKIRFNAADDDVQVKDIYLANDTAGDGVAAMAAAEQAIGERVDFMLYNAAGQLVQTKQMTSGLLHFELANNDRISVAKDGSAFVSVKVNVRDINRANQTGTRLLLELDETNGTNNEGVEAVTAATGSDLGGDQISGDINGEEFVAYRTQISVAHAATQPSMGLPSVASTEAYRFTVTADAARQAALARLTLDVALNGLQKTADANFASADFSVQRVKADGSIDTNSNFPATVAAAPAATSLAARVNIDMTGENLAAGESRTYALFIANSNENSVTAGNNDGSAENSDGVTVTIVRDNAYVAPNNQATQLGVATTNIVWSDESDPSHTATTLDWLNGYLVDIDTTGKRLQK